MTGEGRASSYIYPTRIVAIERHNRRAAGPQLDLVLRPEPGDDLDAIRRHGGFGLMVCAPIGLLRFLWLVPPRRISRLSPGARRFGGLRNEGGSLVARLAHRTGWREGGEPDGERMPAGHRCRGWWISVEAVGRAPVWSLCCAVAARGRGTHKGTSGRCHRSRDHKKPPKQTQTKGTELEFEVQRAPEREKDVTIRRGVLDDLDA